MKTRLGHIIILILILVMRTPVLAQNSDTENSTTENQEPAGSDDPFEDPFSDSGSSQSEDDDTALFDDPFGETDSREEDRDEESSEADDEEASDDLFADPEGLFGGEGALIEEVEEDPEAPAPEDDLLVNEEGIRWSGRFSGSVSSSWSFDSPYDGFDIFEPDDQSLSPGVSSVLRFDARPDPAFRVFGRFDLGTDTGDGIGLETLGIDTSSAESVQEQLPEGWEAIELANGDIEVRDTNGDLVTTIQAEEEGGSTGTTPELSLTVTELFSDFEYNEALFFRFGKHFINWGVGYFWSPGDVLNLTSIDVEDPTADREGPISLRTSWPFGIGSNIYLYLITNDDIEPGDIAAAPKFITPVFDGEVSIAGYYQRTLAPRIIGTLTYSIGDADLFAEGVAQWGSDRVFVRESAVQPVLEDDPETEEDESIREYLTLDTFEVDNMIFFPVTVGGRYLREFDSIFSFTAIGQYFWNPEGYRDSRLLESAYNLFLNPDQNGLTVPEEAQGDDYEPPPALSLNDIANFGRHYAAATVNFGSIAGTDLSANLFSIINLNDLSGIASVGLSYRLFDHASISSSCRLTFGDPGDEYTNPSSLINDAEYKGPTIELSLEASLGGGNF